MIDHVMKMMDLPEIRRSPDARWHGFIEANMGWAKSAFIANALATGTPVDFNFFREKTRKDTREIGFITTEKSKVAMVTALGVSINAGRILFRQDIVSAGSRTGDQLKSEAVMQLSFFKRALRVPADPMHTRTRVSYSGKEGGRKDDLLITVLAFNYYAQLIMQ